MKTNTNSSILKVYFFSGFGNFSTDFGWDNGLDCSLGESTTLKRALEAEQRLIEYNGWTYNLPISPTKGIFYTLNEHGGSRNIEGYVIANSRRNARKMLAELEEKFIVVEYEQD